MAEPYCLAMILCDVAHSDSITGKYSLLGTFNNVGSFKFPAEIAMTVYFALTDGLGRNKIRLQFVKAGLIVTPDEEVDEDTWRCVIGTHKEFESPLDVVEDCVEVGMIVPEPGLYHCELWSNSEQLMTRRFLVEKFTSHGGESHEQQSPS